MKRKIAAIIAADVVGYSRLMAEDEEETMRRLVSYRAVFDDFVTRADGRIFNTAGDAVLAEFPSAVDALRAAIDIQESLRTRNLAYPPSRHMVFRIGLTIGDVIEREGDLLGDGVNIAARLQGLAAPGGICVSRSVHEQVANKLSVFFSDLGPQEVKNIPQPVHAFRVDMDKEAGQKTLVSPQAPSPDSISAPTPPVKSARLPVFSLIAAAAILVGAGAIGSYLLLKKPWSAEESPASKTAARTTTPGTPPDSGKTGSESSRANPASLRTLFGAPFIAAEAPFICDKCREEIAKGLANQPDHTAVALTLDGAYFWTYGRSSAAEARARVLARCLEEKRSQCFVYAIDGRIVWRELPPPLPVKPWFTRDTAQEQPLDVSKIPNLYEEDRPRIAQRYSQFRGKALAVGAFRQWDFAGRADSDEEASRIALERCSYNTHTPCRVIAIGNTFVVASFEVDSIPRMPQTSNATGPVYALSGPRLVPGDIPFLRDGAREQIEKELADRPLHTAVAISFEGRFWHTSNRASAEEARAVVLGNCRGSGQSMCFVYAVDGQVVWNEMPPAMPAKPWFARDPQTEPPLDIGALANLSDKGKETLRDRYWPGLGPKAIAFGPGGYFASSVSSSIAPIRTEEEAARLALERCGFLVQTACRIVAINDKLIVK